MSIITKIKIMVKRIGVGLSKKMFYFRYVLLYQLLKVRTTLSVQAFL
ncbi:Uncharacterized protein dnm_038100 [Desulfonema magnum]|uniref:Uncharacterized protein n=1 Tax=Desulfonema magnum TaxID=45655 RepID=A0A975BLP6_9BACT|nr:Uncharacterized protein dnm_038100 [Desulfonema magnum]